MVRWQRPTNKISVYANMVRWFTILCLRLHLCLNIQKVNASKCIWCYFFLVRCELTHVCAFSIADLIKDSARPSYWVTDREANFCCVCTKPFGTAEDLLSNAKKQTSNGRDSPSPDRSNDSNDSIALAISPSNICDRRRHHCRSCGQAVCDYCSQNRKPVPERGWNSDVRVCDICYKKSPTP